MSDKHLAYRSVHEEPCVVAPSGNLTNHHHTADGQIGARVKPEEATHFVVHTTTVRKGPA